MFFSTFRIILELLPMSSVHSFPSAGQWCDARDSYGVWYTGVVCPKADGDFTPHVFVSIDNYCGQYLKVSASDDIAPAHTKVRQHKEVPLASWKPQDECDAQTKCGRWYPATILKIETSEDGTSCAKVHFHGWQDEYDESIEEDDGFCSRLAPKHSYTDPERADRAIKERQLTIKG